MSTAPLSLTDTAQSAALRESLGNSLLINTVKLFSLLAKADSNVSQAERDYVRFYLESIYHAPVAEYLFEQFEVFVEENIDAEAEVTNIMSEYISMEIDLEILDMLIEDAAAGTEYWSTVNNNVYNPATATFSTAGSAFYNTQGQWFQTLGTKIQKLSNKIHQLTLRGGANFIVTSPTVATVLESIPGFASNNNGDAAQMEYAFGVQKAGQLNGRYTVYKNPYMTENIMLLGYRGSQFLEAGAVFAPYVPLIMTPLVYDPDTFTPRKGLLTRYAKKMLRPEFYGKIYIQGLNTI